jgi:hypothetical protein
MLYWVFIGVCCSQYTKFKCWYACDWKRISTMWVCPPPNILWLSFIPQLPFNSASLSFPISVSSCVHIHQSPLRTDRLFSISLLISPQLRVLLHTTDTIHFAYPKCPPTRASNQSYCSHGRHVSSRPAHGRSYLRGCTAHRGSHLRGCTAHRRSYVRRCTAHGSSHVRGCTAHRSSPQFSGAQCTAHKSSWVRGCTALKSFRLRVHRPHPLPRRASSNGPPVLTTHHTSQSQVPLSSNPTVSPHHPSSAACMQWRIDK